MTYQEWIKEVDRILVANTGFASSDLRDRCWYDSFEAGESPRDAVNELCGDVDDLEEFMRDELFG